MSTLRFGAFELDPADRRLLESGRVVAIGPRAFDLLLLLADRAGHLVTKEEILAAVWPRLIVGQNNVQVQVSALRKVLGAGMIETVAGAGYRFNREVSRTAVPNAGVHDNLPQARTRFLGRERDVAAVREHMRQCPLVTIVGVGGLGKTRLAMRVAEQAKADHANGVRWVDLAAVADPTTVPHAIAAVLGIVPTAEVSEAIVLHLASREMLIVLDNCEHVVAACAALVNDVLARDPRVSILATSREALRIVGETVYSLQPLAEAEAAALFVDRASAVQPGLVVGDHEVVARICQRLDGIPLAIELAAARARVLPLRAIEERLLRQLALLTGGERTALPRQQTLRAMIDWSHDLLTLQERVVFSRLAVFAGGCALADAESVIAGGTVDGRDVLDLVSALVDKSLVVHDVASDRYRLLETIRAYASERLAQSEEEAALRDRHLARFLAFAQRAENELRGPDWALWLARLAMERDNFLDAHAWCGRSHRAEDGMFLLHALRQWWSRTSLVLGMRVAREALAWPAANVRTRARCHAAYAAALIAYYAGACRESVEHAQESLSIAREIGESYKVIDALVVAGLAQLAFDPAGAAVSLGEALDLARASQDDVRTCDALTALAECLSLLDHPDRAAPLYEEALAFYRGQHNSTGIAVSVCNLVRNRISQANAVAARASLIEVAALVDPSAPGASLQQLLVVCAGLATHEGDGIRAAVLYGASEMDLAFRHASREAADEHFLAPLIARSRALVPAQEFGAAEARGRALTYHQAMAEVAALLEMPGLTIRLNARSST